MIWRCPRVGPARQYLLRRVFPPKAAHLSDTAQLTLFESQPTLCSRLPSQHAHTCTAETSRMPGLSSNHEASRLPAEQSLCTMDPDSDACFPRITGVPFATRRLSQPLAGACISAAAGTRDETQPCRQPFPSLSPVPAQLCLRYLEHPALTQALTRPRKPREICRGVVYSSSHVCTADQHSCEPACCR
jgi:hypothetical protein